MKDSKKIEEPEYIPWEFITEEQIANEKKVLCRRIEALEGLDVHAITILLDMWGK